MHSRLLRSVTRSTSTTVLQFHSCNDRHRYAHLEASFERVIHSTQPSFNVDDMYDAGNIGNMPLVIIASICHDDTNPFNLDPTVCNTNGIAYISFGQWVWLFPAWILALGCYTLL